MEYVVDAVGVVMIVQHKALRPSLYSFSSFDIVLSVWIPDCGREFQEWSNLGFVCLLFDLPGTYLQVLRKAGVLFALETTLSMCELNRHFVCLLFDLPGAFFQGSLREGQSSVCLRNNVVSVLVELQAF